jgi:hypothetical protein
VATFNGSAGWFVEYTDTRGYAAPASNFDVDAPQAAWLASHVVGAEALDQEQPIVELQEDRDGTDAPSYGFLHWYNHVHIFATLNLGAVISEQHVDLSVFNAYFVPRTLLSIEHENDTGLTLAGPEDPPYEFGPLQEVIYQLSAQQFGPPTIDATYTFDFDNRSYTVHVVGVRVVAWSWEPNWIQPVKERLEWSTNLIPSFDGHEQARALRSGARQYVEFTYDALGRQRRRLENVLYGWGARVFALPLWWDGFDLVESVAAASVLIPCETTGRDFRASGIGVLIGADDSGDFESFEILAVNEHSIEIKRPLVNAWPIGTRVYPSITARLLDDGRRFNRFTADYARGGAMFRAEELLKMEAADEDLYRGAPVMTAEPNWREQPDVEYARKLEELDLGQRVVFDDQSGVADPMQRYTWTCADREGVTDLKAFLFAREGRARTAWVPSWANDLQLVVLIGAAGTNLDVEHADLSGMVAAGVNRRDIRIELKDGTVFYRRVSGFHVVSDDVERMTIDSALGEDVAPEDVLMISFMSLARQDTDSVEIEYSTREWADAGIALRSVPHDL